MFRKRWAVAVMEYNNHFHSFWPTYIDGPFRFKYTAEVMANTHRAQEAQRARVEGDAMREIDVMEVL